MSKIAVVFFGVVKDFNFLAENFKQKISNSFEKDALDYFCCLTKLTKYINPRNGENSNIPGHQTLLDNFSFKKVVYDDLGDLGVKNDIDLNIEQYANYLCATFGGAWGEHSLLSTNYALRQLYNLNYLLLQLREKLTSYDKIILSRADLFFYDELQANLFMDNSTDVLTPAVDTNGGYSDRFAILSLKGLDAWCSRYTRIKEYPRSYHSEGYLKDTLHSFKLSLKSIEDFKFTRVRYDKEKNILVAARANLGP